MKAKRFCALVIMDGYGLRSETTGNAVKLSGTKNLNKLMQQYPLTQIEASGLAVGLPEGQIGNSEVGHLNLGAGRVVYQDITRIDKSIKDGDFFTNPAFVGAMDNCLAKDSALHLVGLLSNGGVHSTTNHLKALVKMAADKGITKVFVHALMDGRDVPPTSGLDFIKEIESYFAEVGVGAIASVCGRYYFMDRDNRWERVEKGYNAMFCGIGETSKSATAVMEDSYAKGLTDEFIPASVITAGGAPIAKVEDGDSIIFYNFRSDRAREISRAVLEKDFNLFERKEGYKDVFYVGMTEYDASFTGIHTAYGAKDIRNTFGEYIASLGLKQLRIAETEKYAHVTFFFNGGVEAVNEGEKRILIPSPKIATYDLQPEMSAIEVTDNAVAEIEKGELDTMVLNFANCDMVGHTGLLDAAIKATTVVDECVQRIVDAVKKIGGAVIITADHGNAEQMSMPDGSPWTAHTTNPVPFILVDDTRLDALLADGGSLADVIPTILELMELPQPKEMEGKSLIKHS